MKKVLLLIVTVFSLFFCQAQMSESENLLARNLVSKNKEAIGFSAENLNNYIVSSTFDNPRSNCRMVYLQQTYKGIPVFNQMLVLAFRNGNLLSKAGVYDPSFEKLVNTTSGIPARTAESAVQSAIADRKLPVSDVAQTVINRSSKGDFVEFNDMGVSRENITAQLIWAPIENSPKFHLAWQVYIIPKTTSDYWLVRVDAIDSKVIGITNLTDYDDWGRPEEGTNNTAIKSQIKKETNTTYNNIFYFNDKSTQEDIITTATYRVIPFPYESPNHMPSPPSSATVTDPWLAAPGDATTLKWNTGAAGTDYDYTRGNNVWAYQDRTPQNNTGSIAKSASSTTALPNLTFDFVPDYTQEPTVATVAVPNQQFNITNLFYWNNVIHDVFYQYGFTEAGGNFQDDNMGRGGVGNDHVNAEAQDGGGSNNANFATPADGGSGRMQMYLWTAPNPDRDGDVDNGIIIHEHGHGIGKRVTGGPANTACLTTSEQGGEGISDYFGLMLTQDWTTATLTTGFDSPRGVGTYALNQPLTGNGIRPTRYTTNFAINPTTYANISTLAVPHGVGYAWCTMLWDMTWELINSIGVISPNIYDATATGGNIVAMNLVMEGLRLQPCQPGFVDAKNAILQADMNLYAGANQCAIIRAFARRGVGVNAIQGTNSRGDETPDFTGGGPTMEFTQSGAAGVPEGQNIVYNHAVTANCQAITNYTLRDTLPLNVTFVSATNGGSYDGGTRVVSWPVNLTVNATGNYGLTVQVNPGSYFPPVVLLNEPVPSTTISPDWTAASTTANVWVAHNVRSNSPPNSFFTIDAPSTSDQTLATTNSFAIGATAPELSFWHNYVTESSWDGAVLEISTNGGTTWSDIGAANFTQNGYNAILNASANPLGGRAAWNGNSGGFVQTKVNMQPYANQATVKLRWRFGSDGSQGAQGWNVDDIQLQTIAVVNLRTSLFDAGNTRVDIKDTVTLILPLANPVVTINQAVGQPDPTTASPINFTVVFDQPVIDFTTGDVALTGTAGATTGTVTEIAPNDGTTFNVAVTGMVNTGTVIADILAGVCTNAGLDPNNASTSTDNVVNFSLEPLNDLCANAELITCGATVTGTTVGATTDTGTPTCVTSVTSPGVWYRFIGNGGSTTLSLCSGTTYDSKLSVYSGTCAALVCVTGNDDFCGAQSQITFPTTSGTTYYVLVHGSGGATGVFDLTLTCTCPTLSVDPVASQTICNGGATTAVNFTGLEPATVYTWTNSDPSIGLAASGTGNIASFTTTNTGAAPVTATITVTPTYVGCPDGPTTMFTITVLPQPTVNPITSQVLCNGAMTAPVNFTGAVPGTIYNWTNSAPSIGLAGSGMGDIAAFTATNTGTAPVVATVTVTPVTTTGTPAMPVTFSNPASILIPAGQPTTTSGISAPYPSPVTVLGIPTTGVTVASVTLANYSHTFPDDVDVVLVSPTGQSVILMSDAGGGTDATGQTFTFSDAAAGTLSTSAFNPSGTYLPTNYGAGDNYPAPGPLTTPTSTTLSTFTGDYNGTWSLYVVDDIGGDFGNLAGGWSITFLVPGTGVSCTGTPQTFTYTVNPTPVATATPSSQTACSGSAITPIVLSSATAGTTYAWTRDNTVTVTGIAASGNGNISGTMTNTTAAPVTVTFTITPTANGCVGTPITATVTVPPIATVDDIPNQTVCNGTMTAPVNFTGNFPGNIYTWTNNTPSIGLAASGTGDIAAFTATNATLVPVTATVTVTPNVSFPGLNILTGSLGAGDATQSAGRLFRDGVPSVCGATKTLPPPFGSGPYFYDLYTIVNTSAVPQCVTVSYVSASTEQVHVTAYNGSFDPTNINANYLADGGSSSLGGTVNFAFTAPAGATIVFHVFSPNINATASGYTVTINGLPQLCAGPSKTFDITVNPTPTITCPGNITMASTVGACNVAVPYTVTATGVPTPTFSYVLSGATTGSGAGTGTGLLFNVGVTTVTVTATNICGAPTCTFTVTVTDSQLPVINTQPANRTVCVGSSATFSVAAVTAPSAGGPLNYQWQIWNPSTATWSNIAGATASSYTVSNTTLSMNTNSYRVNVIGLCTTITSNHASLYVNPLPTINLTTSIPPDLLPTQVLTITATVSPAGGTYVWRKDGTVIAGATSNTLTGLTVSDAGTYSVVYTDLNGCVSTSSNIVVRAQASGNLYVYPVPNRGVFNVRFYNQTGESVTVRVFDAKGSEVYQRKSATTLPYTTINVDMTTRGILAAGVYVVEVRGADARLIGTKKIIVHNN